VNTLIKRPFLYLGVFIFLSGIEQRLIMVLNIDIFTTNSLLFDSSVWCTRWFWGIKEGVLLPKHAEFWILRIYTKWLNY
jgi:hypothetical protein